MSNLIKDRVIYNGITPCLHEDLNSFSQSTLDSILKIPSNLPTIDDLVKVSVNSDIIDSKLVKTAIGTSLEGQVLTGYKYLSEGRFCVRIDYCCDSLDTCIYTYKSYVYFNSAITLDSSININTRIIPNLYIEDIFTQIINPDEVLLNISFVFIAEEY